jgi:hypothetical protein
LRDLLTVIKKAIMIRLLSTPKQLKIRIRFLIGIN